MFTSVNIVLALTAIEIANSVDIGRFTAARKSLIVNVSPLTSAAPRFEVLKKNTLKETNPLKFLNLRQRRPRPPRPRPPRTTTKAGSDVNFHIPIPDIPNPDIPAENNEELAENLPSSKVNYAQENVGQQWPLGVVPYLIDSNVYDKPTEKRIQKMMNVIESSSCVVFNELDSQPDNKESGWLHITNPTQERECVHEYSQGSSGAINVILGFECLYPNEILHSLLHAIGFKDEVSHPHRDQYIRILWENIQPSYRQLFRIQYEIAPFKLVEYDPMSIMHFHDRAYSVNGAATIAPLAPGLQISPGTTLSSLDVMKLKLAFGHECNKRKVDDLLDTCKAALLSKDPHINDADEDDPQHSLENENYDYYTTTNATFTDAPFTIDSGSGDINTTYQDYKGGNDYGDNDNPQENDPADDDNQYADNQQNYPADDDNQSPDNQANYPADDDNQAEVVDNNDENDGINISAEVVIDDNNDGIDDSPGGGIDDSPGGGIDDSPGGGIDDSPGGGIDDSPGGGIEDNNVASD